MKKILFSAVSLNVGGIETALVDLLEYLSNIKENDEYKYEITLVLEKKNGVFINRINKNVKIIEYTPNNSKIVLFRKFINMVKQLKFKRKYKNKFDFSASYATYSLSGSFVARTASANANLWCHMDYLAQYNNDKEKVKEFFQKVQYDKFKKLIFVSEKSKKTFIEVFPEMEDNVLHINNFINYEDVIKKSNIETKDIDLEKGNTKIFLNVGRHDEQQKKLSRIIKAAKILKESKLDFKVLFVGDGKDNAKYKNMVKELKLEENVIFLGNKSNPYPYFKLADCILISSDYEGSPVVMTEAMVLNKPIISTYVAGAENIENKYGLISEKDEDDIANKMREFIENGYEIKEEFDYKRYNDQIKEQLNKLID